MYGTVQLLRTQPASATVGPHDAFPVKHDPGAVRRIARLGVGVGYCTAITTVPPFRAAAER